MSQVWASLRTDESTRDAALSPLLSLNANGSGTGTALNGPPPTLQCVNPNPNATSLIASKTLPVDSLATRSPVS
ncbi:hypothetical protein CSOJ01_04931 [Colletotrichum sojae]|uniref:Uncharacterized protein n=1 Tax=Colletotrichum sojae TaxID=2175907 RepID=A0A8H6JHS2_9PEZI|nr:hypothetical protein CSOJ01_04931 [Colletotrichum sojae]